MVSVATKEPLLVTLWYCALRGYLLAIELRGYILESISIYDNRGIVSVLLTLSVTIVGTRDPRPIISYVLCALNLSNP